MRNDTVFIVGAGAVENAWKPIIRAIKKTYGIITTPVGANSLMAREIYLLKVYAVFAKKNHYPEAFKRQRENVNTLKHTIASELLESQQTGEVRSRTELKSIISQFANEKSDRISIVTTNWDEVIDNAINKFYRWGKPGQTRNIACHHIHGSMRNPQTLFLPSEITMETYRTSHEERNIGHDHNELMKLVRSSDKTILYGLSLDPLDAELSVTLSSNWGCHKNKEVIIVNPDHEQVAQRVKALMALGGHVDITGYDPSNLSLPIDYT